MKSTEPRDFNLECLNKGDLKSYKLRSLGIASLVIGGAIAITSSMASVAQAQTPEVPAKPLAAGACPDTNAAMMTGEAADRLTT